MNPHTPGRLVAASLSLIMLGLLGPVPGIDPARADQVNCSPSSELCDYVEVCARLDPAGAVPIAVQILENADVHPGGVDPGTVGQLVSDLTSGELACGWSYAYARYRGDSNCDSLSCSWDLRGAAGAFSSSGLATDWPGVSATSTTSVVFGDEDCVGTTCSCQSQTLASCSWGANGYYVYPSAKPFVEVEVNTMSCAIISMVCVPTTAVTTDTK